MKSDINQLTAMQFDKTTLETSIPDAFVQQANRRGQRPAIVTESACISYRELDRLSNCAACALFANGHRHGQTVGVLLEQGILQIAAILGVLKAGGIYVPLDIALGRQRLQEIIQHADPRNVLTDRVNRSMARYISDVQRAVLNIEDDLEQCPYVFQTNSLSPNDRAYIYYTSGTTGEPKGVVDSHRNVLHNIARYKSSLRIGCNDRLTLLQSCGFSGAVSNIFSSLLSGAVLLPFDVRARGVSALAAWLTSVEPTIYHSVPSLFRQLMHYCDTLPTLRIIRLEGDLVRAIDVETFNRHFDGNCTLVNGLGATETGITAQYFIEHDKPLPSNAVPVGSPTRDICIDVVDARDRPLPQGQSGEIVITSRYLATGYWRRSDLTKSAFSGTDDEMRTYRTGDLGRIDRHGLLELHGRVDSLTKVRGEWVDLSDLEATLTRCAGVEDAIAAVPLTAEGESELSAWVLPKSDAKITPANLREMLRSQGWPRNSTPARFFVLQQWPLDPNGKVDRSALTTAMKPSETGSEPRTPLEQLIATVFEQVLEVPSVSRTDDFFALGGDSLKTVEACLEIGRLTGSNRAFGAIQHASSVAKLAQFLSGEVSSGCLVRLQPSGNGPALFCVHAHQGHVFNLKQLAMQFAPEQIFFGVQAKGLDGIERPETVLGVMAATYVANLRTAEPEGPYLIAGYCFGSWVAVEIARQLRDAGQRVNALFLIDPELPKGFLPKGSHDHSGSKKGPFLERLRRITARKAIQFLRYRLFAATSVVRVRSLWLIARLLPASHWFSRIALHRPANAIAIMRLDYRPRPYDGDAHILMPADKLLEPHQREAWGSFIKGTVEFETLAGKADEILREPYTRDLAACLMGHISRCG